MLKIVTDGSVLFSLTNNTFELDEMVESFKEWLYDRGGDEDTGFESKSKGGYSFYAVPEHIRIDDIRQFFGDTLDEIETGGMECQIKQYTHKLSAKEKKELSTETFSKVALRSEVAARMAEAAAEWKRRKKEFEDELERIDAEISEGAIKHNSGSEKRLTLCIETKDWVSKTIEVIDKRTDKVIDKRPMTEADLQMQIDDQQDELPPIEDEGENGTASDTAVDAEGNLVVTQADGDNIENFTDRPLGSDLPM